MTLNLPRHPRERVAAYRALGAWTDETIDDLLTQRVAAAPDVLAIADPPNKPDLVGLPPRRLTWREFDAAVDALANTLLSHGVGPGDVVGVQLPNIVEIAQTFCAAVRIGAVICPFPVQFREHELTTLADRAELTAFVTASRIGERAAATLPSVPTKLAFGADLPPGFAPVAESADPGRLRRHRADPLDPVTICWTSGTEAAPKGVPRCHADWLAICWGTVDAPRLTDGDVLLNPFPMVNMAGINGMFLPWLRVGGLLVQHHPFDLPVFLRQLHEERATYTVAPPAVLSMLLARDDLLAGVDLSALRLIGSGSAPLPPSMVRGWRDRYGIEIVNFFGSNEGIALLSSPEDIPDPEARAQLFPRYGAPGRRWASRIADWTSVRLVDPETETEVVEPGRAAELRIKGPTVFAGYLGGGEPFDADGYYRTGDLFEISGPDNAYLRFVDRAGDVVNRGGMKVAPAEVEALLATHPGVADVAVIGYPDPVLGERVCAVVVPRPGAAVTLDDVVGFLRDQQIASYKLPERLEVVDALPRNPVGKVLKRELRERVPV